MSYHVERGIGCEFNDAEWAAMVRRQNHEMFSHRTDFDWWYWETLIAADLVVIP